MAALIRECIDYIISTDNENAYKDAVNLLRNINYADGSVEEIKKKIEGTYIIRQKDPTGTVEETAQDENITCSYIRDKYGLDRYDVCEACVKNNNVTEEENIRERNLMLAIFSQPINKDMFSEKKDVHEYILSRFKIYETYKNTDSLNSYMMVNKSIYEAVYSLVNEKAGIKKNKTESLGKLITAEQVLERWKFYNAGCCGDEFTNDLIKTKIDYYHSHGSTDTSVFEYYLPPKKRKRAAKPEQIPEIPEQTEEQMAREQAIAFDDINILMGGEQVIDRTEPVQTDGKEEMLVPEFTEEEIERAGYIKPDTETVENLSYYAIRKEKTSMDVIRIAKLKQLMVLFSIMDMKNRYVITGEQIIKMSNYTSTKKSVITKEPVALFAFMHQYDQKPKLSVFQPIDKKTYLHSVMKKNSCEHFLIPAINDDLIQYHKAFSYSAGHLLNNISRVDSELTLANPIQASSSQNIVSAKIMTPFSIADWHDFKINLFKFLANNNQFKIQNMYISNIIEENHEIWFNVAKDKCRGFTTVLSRTISEYIKKCGYFPDVKYHIL